MVETIRMNLAQLEAAQDRGDKVTAKRCVDAAERMFGGLREVLNGSGLDVGGSAWAVEDGQVPTTAQAAEPEVKAPPVFDRDALASGGRAWPAGITHAELWEEWSRDPVRRDNARLIDQLNQVDAGRRASDAALVSLRRAFDASPPVDQWLRRVHLADWRWNVLARLTRAWLRCVVGLLLKGLRKRP